MEKQKSAFIGHRKNDLSEKEKKNVILKIYFFLHDWFVRIEKFSKFLIAKVIKKSNLKT